jgi:6,7-dimethyl-8-ribityllumazine synthase
MASSNSEVKTVVGQLSARGLRVALVAARFNELIVDRLVDGAIDAIVRSGGSAGDITVFRCPGAWEIPQVARRAVESRRFDAVIGLGAVIRGATAHFDYVAGEAARGLGGLASQSPIPIVFGVLTTDTIEQAIERAGTKAGNKGFEAAMVAIEMVNLFREMGPPAGAGGAGHG